MIKVYEMTWSKLPMILTYCNRARQIVLLTHSNNITTTHKLNSLNSRERVSKRVYTKSQTFQPFRLTLSGQEMPRVRLQCQLEDPEMLRRRTRLAKYLPTIALNARGSHSMHKNPLGFRMPKSIRSLWIRCTFKAWSSSWQTFRSYE